MKIQKDVTLATNFPVKVKRSSGSVALLSTAPGLHNPSDHPSTSSDDLFLTFPALAGSPFSAVAHIDFNMLRGTRYLVLKTIIRKRASS
jgi:hypothetical protein